MFSRHTAPRTCLTLSTLLLTALLSAPASAQTLSANPNAPKTTTPAKPAAQPPTVTPPKTPTGHKPKPKPHTTPPPAPAPAPAAAPTPAPAPPPPTDAGVPERSGEGPKGSVTGLPLPRFAALRSDEVNLRTGPGTRYPIDWVYRRRDLPVEIEREFEVWRLIEDPDGTKGWVHQATLTGRRSFIVKGQDRLLRTSADPTSAPVAKLKPGVVGRIRSCDTSAWCQVQVGDYRGYLQRDEIWGTFAGEAVN